MTTKKNYVSIIFVFNFSSFVFERNETSFKKYEVLLQK